MTGDRRAHPGVPGFHHLTVFAIAFLAKCLGNRVGVIGRVLQAIDQVMSIFAFEALVERERFQAASPGSSTQTIILPLEYP